MKHLLFLTPGFAADELDSRCIPPLQLFIRQLHQTQVIKISILSLHYPFTCEAGFWHGIPFYSAYKKGRWNKLSIGWQVKKWVQKIHREHPLDGIHSFWLSDAALLGQWLSKWYGVSHIVTLMGQDARPSNKYLRFFSLKKLYSIALSDFHNKKLEQSTGVGAKKIIPWGINPSEFPPPVSPKHIDILGVGNLIKLKDYALFIRLIQRIAPDYPLGKVVLIGDGPERKNLERLVSEAGLTNQIKFTGYLPRQDVLEYMARSKILLHPSTFESFGFVFLEALASGMTIVSKPVGIAQAGERWFLGNNDPELEAVLLKALKNFDNPKPSFPCLIDVTIEKYLAFYEEVFSSFS